MMESAMNNIPKPCQDFFAEVTGASWDEIKQDLRNNFKRLSIIDMRTQANNIVMKYDGTPLTGADIRHPLIGPVTYQFWWGLGSGGGSAIATARGGNISFYPGPATILLGEGFYNPPRGTFGDYIFGSITIDGGRFASVKELQSQVLVHEFMHLYTGMSDRSLAAALSSKGARISAELTSAGMYSEAIAQWQSQGCPRRGRGDQ
jgi:hypothetical protein